MKDVTTAVAGVEVKVVVDDDRVYVLAKHADGKELPDEVWAVNWFYMSELPGERQEQINGSN